MIDSLLTDPMSWWPVGFVVGGLFGAGARWIAKRRVTRDTHPYGVLRADHAELTDIELAKRLPAAKPTERFARQ
jgi:hypothetical protein